MHMPEGLWNAAVGHDDCDLMECLWKKSPEVPVILSAPQTGAGVALDSVVEVREAERIAEEKDWSIVSDDVPISLFSVELQSKPADIALRIGCPAFASDGRKAREHRLLLTRSSGVRLVIKKSLFAPGRVKDDAAKVGPFEFRVEQREHVVVHGSESGLRLVAEPIVEGVDDLLLEVIPARMGVDYRLPVRVGYVEVANPEDVHLYARCHQAYFRLLVLRAARRSVERDGVPHHINGWLVDAMLPQEVTRGVGTINFEALGGAAVFLAQADVVKHHTDVQQLAIELH